MDNLLGDGDRTNASPVHNQSQDEYGSTHLYSSSSSPRFGESAKERMARLTSMQSDESSIMSFHDVNYHVMTKVRPCTRAVRKDILSGVSGIFKPGMNAVMGPTGSGKSSLLDVLAGRKEPQGLRGTILLDGLPPPENFKVLVGYVSQTTSYPQRVSWPAPCPAVLKNFGSGRKDKQVISPLCPYLDGTKRVTFLGVALVFGHNNIYCCLGGKPLSFKTIEQILPHKDDCVTAMLTIRENFAFSAALRLPKSVGKVERDERVNQVIMELGLNDVADSKVGNEFVRGISGGERKRCNIGMELIISPPVLFLDEPTTGLDASTANAVMHLLKKMASRGRNIIFAIHQPRYSIYRLFDSLMLLSYGQVVYHGASADSLNFFRSIGFECDTFNNPADFFLDVINGDSTAITSLRDPEEKNGTANGFECDTFNNPADFFLDVINGDSTAITSLRDPEEKNGTANGHCDHEHKVEVEVSENHQEYLVEKYQLSTWNKKLQEELEPIIENLHKEEAMGKLVQLRKVDYKTSFFDQLLIVSGRAIKNLLRNPQVYVMQFFVVSVFALIVSAVYYQLTDSRTSGIQNRIGAFFFIVMNQVFGNMSAVELFIKERAIFIHENTSGFYRVSAYFLAKVFCDVIPMRMVPAVIFSAIAYFMIGFRDGIDHFLLFTLTLFLTALAASALSFFISSSVRIFAVANLCLALSYVFMMLFSGLLINISDILPWLSWVKYFSIFRFSLNTLDINELKDAYFCGNSTGGNEPPSCLTNVTCVSGNAYLEGQGIDYKTEWDLWANVMALGIMIFVYMLMTYVQLLRIKKLN